jgi:hypothetical protein
VQEALPTVRAPALVAVNPEKPGEPVTGEAPAGLLEDIRIDLAERSQARQEEMVVMREQSVTWRDGSLGCPQPGIMYTQAVCLNLHRPGSIRGGGLIMDLVILGKAYGLSMTNNGEVQVSQWAGFSSSPRALRTEITA